LLIWTSETQVMLKRSAGSQIGSLTPDHKKSRIDPIYLAVDNMQHTVGKLSTIATTVLRSHLDPRSSRKVMGLQSRKSPRWRDFGTPTRESRERKAISMWALWRGPEYTIRGKVVASPKSGPWWVLCVRFARGSS